MRKSLSQRTRKENEQIKKEKQWYLIHTWSDKAFKDIVVNRALPNLHGWSLEITHTVPLRLEIGIEPVAEFKEFERRFNFKPRLKYGWFHLKLYQMFQDLSRRLI